MCISSELEVDFCAALPSEVKFIGEHDYTRPCDGGG
jgi:hypothetical protein